MKIEINAKGRLVAAPTDPKVQKLQAEELANLKSVAKNIDRMLSKITESSDLKIAMQYMLSVCTMAEQAHETADKAFRLSK